MEYLIKNDVGVKKEQVPLLSGAGAMPPAAMLFFAKSPYSQKMFRSGSLSVPECLPAPQSTGQSQDQTVLETIYLGLLFASS